MLNDAELKQMGEKLKGTLHNSGAPEAVLGVLEIMQNGLREHLEGSEAAPEDTKKELVRVIDRTLDKLEKEIYRYDHPVPYQYSEGMLLAFELIADLVERSMSDPL